MKTDDGGIRIASRLVLAILAAALVALTLVADVAAQTQPPQTFPWNDGTHQVQANGKVYVFSALSAVGVTPAFQTLSSWHAFLLVVTGSPSTCKFFLQGSLDGQTWFALDGTTVSCASTGYFVVGGGTQSLPVTFVRGNLSVLSGGSTPTVTLQYVGR